MKKHLLRNIKESLGDPEKIIQNQDILELKSVLDKKGDQF